GYVAESERCRFAEHRGIEPFVYPIVSRARLLGALAIVNGPAETTKGIRQVGGTEEQGKAALERCNAIDSPARDQLASHSARAVAELLALAKRQIQNIAQHEALRHVEADQRALRAKVVAIGIAPACRRGSLQPTCERVGIRNELGHGVAGEDSPTTSKPLFKLHLQR